MSDAFLLAVAVHDETEARLEPTGVEEVRCEAGSSPSFRVSYRMADAAGRKESAQLVARFRLNDGTWSHQEARMKDRPLRDDQQQGELLFRVGPLSQGTHVVEYRFEFDVSDQRRLGGLMAKQSLLEGQVRVLVR